MCTKKSITACNSCVTTHAWFKAIRAEDHRWPGQAGLPHEAGCADHVLQAEHRSAAHRLAATLALAVAIAAAALGAWRWGG